MSSPTSHHHLLLFVITTLLLVTTLPPTTHAFSTPTTPTKKNIIVVSPPGGTGEVAAVSCATLGASVKWCVVTPPPSSKNNQSKKKNTISLSEESLRDISSAGGNIDIVGIDAMSLLNDEGDEGDDDTRRAVKLWSREGIEGDVLHGIVCTVDVGDDDENVSKDPATVTDLGNAVKIAVRDVCTSPKITPDTTHVVISDSNDSSSSTDDDSSSSGSILSLLKKSPSIPPTLLSAIPPSSSTTSLRHGTLFGLPSSSTLSSPFIDGPRRTPRLRDEYTFQGVKLTPRALPQTRTSRLALGDAAAAAVLSDDDGGLPEEMHVSSLRGVDRLGGEEWREAFEDCKRQATLSDEIFRVELVVGDRGRLADWLATKWAPAILRSYEIAGIRVGERPVYASRVSGGGEEEEEVVEVVWQSMVNFESTTVGKMRILVGEGGVVAVRDEGRRVGLQGEDVLVKSLGDAAGQAVEKGLAKKPKRVKPKKQTAAATTPATTVVSSGNVAPPPTPSSPAPESLESGPRTAGARRSSQRTRGKRRKSTTTAAESGGESSDRKTTESWQ